MGKGELGKRTFLKGVGASAIAVAFAGRAFAQDGKILGIKLPQEVIDILPRKPMSYLRVADSVITLEREADRKGLPQSPLALGKGASLSDVVDSLYQFAMPRLVALVDRSEATDLGFADRAGELLAELHASQHELPDMLRTLVSGSGAPSPKDKGLRFLVQDEAAAPVIVFQPGVPPAPELPEGAAPGPVSPSPVTPPRDDTDRPLSKARDYASLKAEYGRMFRTLSVRPQFADSANWHLEMMQRSRDRYARVEAVTGVPWFFIAVTHGLEASFNFRAHLHNGDFPLSARTRQVPAGRPTQWLPPSDWESSAKDALRLLGYTGQKDWSLERTLYRLEAYNGLGYRSQGVPTPYLWSFSNHYERGKFVADGKFSHTARSQQCGAAVMLKLLSDAGEIALQPAG